ncbi:hypothetical protein ACFOGJ_16205 [Marinibaculum pumilum]|uniref:Uncharacterized protein n=1 Tax=Marinibaculum pumilum TaxID=1766165 RepID=A0ABV7L294_9PROT
MQHSSQHVEFYRRTVQDNNRTSIEGRPVFDDKVYCRIFIPGDMKNVWDQPVREKDKQRFPQQWAAFINDDDRPSGTPLHTLTIIYPSEFRPADAETLKAQKVFTVEQLSALPDSAIKVLGPASRQWVKLAQDHLAKSDTSGLKEENEALRSEMEELKAQMAELMQRRKGGRPPKVKTDEPADDRSEHV